MIEIKGFNKVRDYEVFAKWRTERGLKPFMSEDLPDTGFLAICDGVPVGCTFLVLTNAQFAFMEETTFAPTATPEQRAEIALALADASAKVAKDLGFKRLAGFTKSKGLVEKLGKAGWTLLGSGYHGGVKEL